MLVGQTTKTQIQKPVAAQTFIIMTREKPLNRNTRLCANNEYLIDLFNTQSQTPVYATELESCDESFVVNEYGYNEVPCVKN